MSPNPNGIGVALSGGGYRATAFHLGTLRKLNELGVLSRVDVLSTISGGSITGACYCCWTGNFDAFYNDLYSGLQKKNVITRILLSWLGFRFLVFLVLFFGNFYFLFSGQPWVFLGVFTGLILILLRFQFLIFPISNRIEQIYNKFFYNNKTLGHLIDKPNLVMSSTNLQTARPFSFSKERMGDSTYQFLDDPIEFKPMNFPIARAVMASSCVPFAFTPVTIAKEFYLDPAQADKKHPVLVDGGVYDNQGIHKVMQKGRHTSPYVITSDAGSGSSGELVFKNTLALLGQTVNVFMSRIKNAQMARNVYDHCSSINKEIAYFSLGWDVENCIPGFIKNLQKKQIPLSVIERHALKAEWVESPMQYKTEITAHLKKNIGYDELEKPSDEEKKIARKVKTGLSSLSKKKVDCLIKQAMALTAVQVKLYCPSILI